MISDQGVSGAMGFIESILSELSHLFVEFLRDVWGDIFLFCAIDEGDFKFFHHIGIFFTHGFTELVGLIHGQRTDDLSDLHDLFLIDNDAIGFL